MLSVPGILVDVGHNRPLGPKEYTVTDPGIKTIPPDPTRQVMVIKSRKQLHLPLKRG